MSVQQGELNFFASDVAAGKGYVVGVDEVGRGPLVGDVVAAAVILPENCALPLKDSKALSDTKRNRLTKQIKAEALDFCIARATPQEIDELNILHATMLAMQRAVDGLKLPIEKVLVDGNRCPDIPHPCEAIVKGDGKVAEISAASIWRKCIVTNRCWPCMNVTRNMVLTATKLPDQASFGKISRAWFDPGVSPFF